MMGAIQLHQFATVCAAGPPRAVGAGAPPEMIDTLGPQPASQRLIAEREAMMRRQLFHGQRRTIIAIVARVELENLLCKCGRFPPVRRMAPAPMREPAVAFGLQPVAEETNLPRRDSQRLTGLLLRELVLDHLANHMDPPQFVLPHDNTVLSGHSVLLVRASSLQRTFLLWEKRTLSLWDYSMHLIERPAGSDG